MRGRALFASGGGQFGDRNEGRAPLLGDGGCCPRPVCGFRHGVVRLEGERRGNGGKGMTARRLRAAAGDFGCSRAVRGSDSLGNQTASWAVGE